MSLDKKIIPHEEMNFSHLEDNIKICQFTRKTIQYSLLWPRDGTEFEPGFEYKMKIFAYFTLTGVMTLSLLTQGYLTIKNGESLHFEEAAIIVATFGTYYVLCCYIFKRYQIALYLHDISDFKYFGMPPGFHQLNKRLDFLSRALLIYCALATTLYTLVKYLKKAKCEKIQASRGKSTKFCGLMFQIWVPFNINYFPVFQLIMLYGYLAALLHIKMSLFISFQLLETVCHIMLKMEHLKSLVLESFDTEDDVKSFERLKMCVAYHLHILDLITRTDETFSAIMFAHLVLTSTILACLEMQIVEEDDKILASLHFLGWVLALFIACFAGQYFADADQIISNALYGSKWFQLDTRLKKSLLIMLLRSQKKCHVSAGPFGILSYGLFVSVLKASYSILCVLNS